MAGTVNHHSEPPAPRIQARTRLARRAVVDAARTLFLEHGYTSTTIAAISELADVPPATVYRLFASKIGILKALLDTSIAGDDKPVAVSERPQVAALHDLTDPRQLIAGFAAVTTSINTRSHHAYRVLTSAADSDPEAANLLAGLHQQRDEGQRQLTRGLKRLGSLKDGLSPRAAHDLVHALMSPELYRLLVVDRNWSTQYYQEWLTELLTSQLTDQMSRNR